MRSVYLALDYGRKRIGIAVSTAIGTVHPRPRLERRSLDEDFAELGRLLAETEAEAVVMGLPHHMDGTVSEMEREVREFAVKLSAALGLPVYGMDERLTTEAAESALRAGTVRSRARKQRRDSAAACIVLQDFLDTGTTNKERIA